MPTERELDEHMPAVKIMRKWGTNARWARAIGRRASTTDRHLANGYFVGSGVAQLVADIIAAAKRDDIIIRPSDFVDMRLFEAGGDPA